MSGLQFGQHGDDCVSERSLDALHAGALSAERAAAVQDHLAGCASCRARLATIEEGFDGFPQFDERRALAQIRTAIDARTRRRRWWMPMIFAGAAAAAVFLAVRQPPDPLAGAGLPVARVKGKAALRIFKRTAEGSAEVGADERLAAGTQIRFGVDLIDAGAVRVLARDGAALVELAKAALPAGNAQMLPGAVALDDSSTDEQLYLVHCPGAFSVPECRVEAGTPTCPAPCTVTATTLKRR